MIIVRAIASWGVDAAGSGTDAIEHTGYDLRPFLYPSRFPWQFRKIDEAAARWPDRSTVQAQEARDKQAHCTPTASATTSEPQTTNLEP